MTSQTLKYQDGDTSLEAYVAYDENITGPRPLILISHAWDGRTQFVCDKAEALAKLGYVGFALDVYGDAKIGTSVEENAAMMQPFLDHRAKLQQRLQAAIAAAQSLEVCDNNNMAAIGYCFGGLCVLDMARGGAALKGVISNHGLLNPPGETQANIQAKVLVLHGNDDPMVPPEQVLSFNQEMTLAQADWQLHAYGNTKHSFTNPEANNPDMGSVYNADADRRAWQTSLNFFDELFS